MPPPTTRSIDARPCVHTPSGPIEADRRIFLACTVPPETHGAAGDDAVAAERLGALEGIPLRLPAPEIPKIAQKIMSRVILPPKAQVDALHIAAGAHHRIRYLLTCNCKHIAGATGKTALDMVETRCRERQPFEILLKTAAKT